MLVERATTSGAPETMVFMFMCSFRPLPTKRLQDLRSAQQLCRDSHSGSRVGS